MSLSIRLSFLAASCCLAFGQTPESEPRPKFDAVDAHVSAKTPNAFVRTSSRDARYQVKTATMLDLIRIAYGYDADKILGGPSWLEMDRFDVTGKTPAESNAEQHKLMLQSALEDRFGLKVHKETKPLKAYALVKGKKVLMKEASGDEETGCKPESTSAGGPRPEGGGILMFANSNGQTQTFAMGPGNTLTYHCRNVTMASFVTALRGFFGLQLGTNPIQEETGLEGRWNFDLRYSMSLFGPMMNNSDRVSIFDAVEKQLGLKLEERAVPMPVLIVDAVNRTPTPNPPEVAAALPPIPPPTEFEVASIKPVDLNAGGMGPRMVPSRMEPGGRFVSQGMPLSFLISQAFNTSNSEEIVGSPGFASSDRYDIIAKAPGEAVAAGPMDRDLLAPMLLNLLVDRFKLKYHREDRQVTAYNLVAAKPKMKKAEPGSRTSCKNENAPPGSPPGSRALICQNVTMAQFADRLHNMSRELAWPVADETRIEGGWDLTLIYGGMGGMRVAVGVPPPPPPLSGMTAGAAGPAPGGEGAMPNASDPMGGYTIFDAIEKQLGLKLEKTKRTGSVIVIDHMEQRPTEN